VTRLGVIGIGSMGRNHVRVLHEMAGVDVVGVADFDTATVARVSSQFGTRGFDRFEELLEQARPDAVTVAVPTRAHWHVVNTALSAGCHVLVEKPIAATIDEACQLVTTADALGRVLMVGHVERYNPAVIELKRRLEGGDLGRVFQIHTRRLGPFPRRVQDVGVVVDLATHDLDIMRYLTGSEALRVYAETKREIHSSNEDLLSGTVRFANDMLGLLEINWLTPTKIRELYVTGERGMFRADYLTQDLYFYENEEANGSSWNTLTVLHGVSEGAMTRFALKRVEPLRAELEAFVAAAEGRASRIVTGRDGLAALQLAILLIRSGAEHEVLAIPPSGLDLTEGSLACQRA
jgi:UDP-N-acetylglucosamine 3-dehydrogenase